MTIQLAGEWTTYDKGEWGDGPWQQEPDKLQWVDEATGYDCLMVRNRSGNWCGYVGVPVGHPFHGKDYDDVPVDVHGGLTFADGCHEPTREGFEKIKGKIAAWREEASRFPRGDSAEYLRENERFTAADDYEGWRSDRMKRSICHVPRPEVGEVWWLGFDTAHSGDYSPSHARLGPHFARSEYETYKDRAYTEAEVTRLAAQLAAPTGEAQ